MLPGNLQSPIPDSGIILAENWMHQLIVYFLCLEFYHENCDCPQKNHSIWSEAMSCPTTYKQIDTDLAKFKDIDLEQVAKRTVERFGQHHALVHYSIIKNKVFNLF